MLRRLRRRRQGGRPAQSPTRRSWSISATASPSSARAASSPMLERGAAERGGASSPPRWAPSSAKARRMSRCRSAGSRRALLAGAAARAIVGAARPVCLSSLLFLVAYGVLFPGLLSVDRLRQIHPELVSAGPRRDGAGDPDADRRHQPGDRRDGQPRRGASPRRRWPGRSASPAALLAVRAGRRSASAP